MLFVISNHIFPRIHLPARHVLKHEASAIVPHDDCIFVCLLRVADGRVRCGDPVERVVSKRRATLVERVDQLLDPRVRLELIPRGPRERMSRCLFGNNKRRLEKTRRPCLGRHRQKRLQNRGPRPRRSTDKQNRFHRLQIVTLGIDDKVPVVLVPGEEVFALEAPLRDALGHDGFADTGELVPFESDDAVRPKRSEAMLVYNSIP